MVAIITERYDDGRVKTLRSSVALTADARAAAEKLDHELSNRVATLEKGLVAHGLLDPALPPVGASKPRGGAALWHAVGTELDAIVKEYDLRGARERRWLWEAINLHASERIRRVNRGRTRQHFEYCYRLAQLPLSIAKSMFWSEWVYFFDSLTVREEPRADRWLLGKLKADAGIDRLTFRRFTENLNRRIRKTDTSVLTDDELFALYDSIWAGTDRPRSNPSEHE
jgi:hypothetical protein